MSVEQIKSELSAIPEQILDGIVQQLSTIEQLFERHYTHVRMITHGSADPGGGVTEILQLLAQAKQDTADLIGYEDRIRAAIQSYVSGF